MHTVKNAHSKKNCARHFFNTSYPSTRTTNGSDALHTIINSTVIKDFLSVAGGWDKSGTHSLQDVLSAVSGLITPLQIESQSPSLISQ